MSKLSLESLPIFPILPDIRNFININEKGAILGNTGIGKSLGIPAYLSNLYPKMRYYIAVPNWGTAKSLAYTQKNLSKNVKVSFADNIHPPPEESNIVYATIDYIKDLFFDSVKLKNTSNSFTDILFIDEAHMNNIDNYIIIKLWEYLHNNNSDIKIPRLYLLSSTLDQNIYKGFETFNIKIQTFPISIKYNSIYYDLNSRKIYDDMASIILNQHKLLSLNVVFMAFMAGKKDILNLMTKLKLKFSEMNINNYTLVPAHGELTSEDNQKIYMVVKDGRKIIITTNLFESAITIPDSVVVFDSMLEKRHISNSNYETGTLITSYISKASANQRAGRSGRTSEGTVFRMCTIQKFEELENFRPLDIYTVPIYNIITKLILTDVKEIINILPQEILLKAPNAINLMKNLGVINKLGNITELGMFYYKSRLSIRSACVIWWWLKTNSTNYYSGIILALIINNYSDTYFHYNWEEINTSNEGIPFSNTEISINKEKYKLKYFLKFKGESDIHTYMNALLDLTTQLLNEPNLDVRKQINNWCMLNSFKYKRILSIYETSKRIMLLINKEVLTSDGKSVVMNLYSTNETIYQMIPILKNVFFDKIFQLVKNYYINIKNNEHRYTLDNNSTVNNFLEKIPNQLISFSEFILPQNHLYKINMALNIEINDKRNFNYNIIDIKQRIPKRANHPKFEGVIETTYIKYPPINTNLIFRMPFEPEHPTQNLIEIGLTFPYRK